MIKQDFKFKSTTFCLKNKNGFLNLRIPGTIPTQTETLIFIDVETPTSPARSNNAAGGSTTLRGGVKSIEDEPASGKKE